MKVQIIEIEKGKKYKLDYSYTEGGKRKRKRETIECNKAIAEERSNKIIHEHNTAKYLGIKTIKDMPVEKFLKEKYLPYVYSIKTEKQARMIEGHLLKKFVPFVGKNILLSQINREVIDNFMANRLANFSSETARKSLVFLNNMFDAAIDWNNLSKNPSANVTRPKPSKKSIRWLREYEIEKLLKACRRERIKNIILLALHTGMRAGELISLKWSDIIWGSNDASSGLAFLGYDKGRIHIRNSKNGDERVIPINASIRKILNALPKVNNFVFEGRGYRDAYDYAREKSEIEGIRFHDLRHTFATYLVMKKTDIRTVQYLLGHKTIAMTMRYTHFSENNIQEALESLDKVFSLDTFGTHLAKVNVGEND